MKTCASFGGISNTRTCLSGSCWSQEDGLGRPKTATEPSRQRESDSLPPPSRMHSAYTLIDGLCIEAYTLPVEGGMGMYACTKSGR